MTGKSNIKVKKLKSLLSNLANEDSKKQIEAIKSLKVHGDESIIEPLLEVYMKTSDLKVQHEIVDLLNTTKSTMVPDKVAQCLVNKKYKTVHQILLASVWNSGLDYTNYLKDIVQATIDGDMMFAIDCITIIENIEGEFTEDNIFEPLLILKEYLVANKDVNNSKMDLLKEITMTLQKINDHL